MADGTLQARAIRMLHAGDPAKLVAQTTGLALADVQQLQRDVRVNVGLVAENADLRKQLREHRCGDAA